MPKYSNYVIITSIKEVSCEEHNNQKKREESYL